MQSVPLISSAQMAVIVLAEAALARLVLQD